MQRTLVITAHSGAALVARSGAARAPGRSFAGTRLARSVDNGSLSKCRAFWNSVKNSMASLASLDSSSDEEPALTRADYGDAEVTEYFNYMGMLAEEGTYDRLEEMLASGVAAVDLLLLMSCKEGDTPKVEELLAAGADLTIKDKDGKTAMDLATKEEVIEMLEAAMKK